MYSIFIYIKDFFYNNIYIGFLNIESVKFFMVYFMKLNVCFIFGYFLLIFVLY